MRSTSLAKVLASMPWRFTTSSSAEAIAKSY
jgi:hypothetical protein